MNIAVLGRSIRVAAAVTAVGAALPGAALAQNIADPGFLDQYAATNRFRQGNPTAITLTPEGDAVLFLRSGPRTYVNDLYEFDCATGKERVLLTAEGILKGAEEKLTAEELARRERARSSARGIAGYSLSDDGAKILTTLSGRLFVVDRKSGAVRELKSEHSAKFPIDARFSPDGAKVSVVRDGDLYVIDIGAGAPTEGRERRLTTKSNDTITNGLAEFVAQEEMGRSRGYWWSPDSGQIAFEQADTKGMEMFSIADPMDPGKASQTWPYPRTGGKNASVRLGVLNLKSGATEGGLPGTVDPMWVTWDVEQYPYLATVRWDKGAPLAFVVQDRAQTHLMVAQVRKDGRVEPLLYEKDDVWLNLDQSFPRDFFDEGNAYLWSNEYGGAWELHAKSRDNGINQTHKSTRQSDIHGVVVGPSLGYRGGLGGFDESRKTIYVTAGSEPTQTHVFRVPLDKSESKQLTAGSGHNGATFSKNCKTCVHTFSADGKQTWTVRKVSDWSPIGELTSVAEKPSFPISMEITEVTTTDQAQGLESLGFKPGAPISFKAMVIRPRNFDKSKKYPVIDAVYGGPHSQTVSSSGVGQSLNQWIADHGFIVVSIDGRGTPSRGRNWERAIKNDLIKIPLLDQCAGLKALGEKFPEMDMSRVGIYGWSFGGYFSAMAAMREPTVFKCGVAGAPVCDWRDYDTHYTERYMGMPEENKAGYDAANVLTYCKDLTRPLLIIHGTADDNVYFMHSLKMSNALFRAGKQHEFLPLAGFTHMVPDPVVMKSLYGRIVGFLGENLKE